MIVHKIRSKSDPIFLRKVKSADRDLDKTLNWNLLGPYNPKIMAASDARLYILFIGSTYSYFMNLGHKISGVNKFMTLILN